MSLQKGPILGFQFIFFSQLVREHDSSGKISSNPINVIILITIIILLLIIHMKNLHHLVEDVVAALHLLLESDPSFFKQVCLDVAPEKYTYANKSPPTNDNYVNNKKLQISPSQFSLGVEVDADELALDEESDSIFFLLSKINAIFVNF